MTAADNSTCLTVVPVTARTLLVAILMLAALVVPLTSGDLSASPIGS